MKIFRQKLHILRIYYDSYLSKCKYTKWACFTFFKFFLGFFSNSIKPGTDDLAPVVMVIDINFSLQESCEKVLLALSLGFLPRPV